MSELFRISSNVGAQVDNARELSRWVEAEWLPNHEVLCMRAQAKQHLDDARLPVTSSSVLIADHAMLPTVNIEVARGVINDGGVTGPLWLVGDEIRAIKNAGATPGESHLRENCRHVG